MDKYYDKIADGYDELYREEQYRKVGLIVEKIGKLNLNVDAKVLDVGCGSGFSSILGERLIDGIDKKNIIGIDPSRELLKKNSYETMCCFAEDMPFEDSSFDLVFSLTAAQNFIDLERGLNEIFRVGRNYFILSILKNSKYANDFCLIIKNNCKVIMKIVDKDIIFFCKRK